jgi:hypothetical protein
MTAMQRSRSADAAARVSRRPASGGHSASRSSPCGRVAGRWPARPATIADRTTRTPAARAGSRAVGRRIEFIAHAMRRVRQISGHAPLPMRLASCVAASTRAARPTDQTPDFTVTKRTSRKPPEISACIRRSCVCPCARASKSSRSAIGSSDNPKRQTAAARFSGRPAL